MSHDNKRHDPYEPSAGRRHYLKWVGLGGSLSLAGCLGGDGGDTPTETDETPMDDDGGSDTTPTATPTPVPGSDRFGGHLRAGFTNEPQDMNPMLGIFADKLVMEYMYSRLTQLGPRTEVIPALATDWEHAGDARAWTFTLREGVVFPNTDGEEVLAQDVKASAEAVLDDELTPQQGTAHAGDVESIEIEDDYRITITLKSPDLFYTKRIAENGNIFNIVPKSVIDNRWDDLSTTDFGTGPFNMVEVVPDDRIEFERNPHYFRTDENGNQLPYVDRFTYQLIPDSLAQVSALRDTRIDALEELPFTQLPRLATNNEINIQSITTRAFRHTVLNTLLEIEDGRKPFDDVKVRKAMKHAMDHEEMKAAVDDTVTIGHHDPVAPSQEFYADFPEGLEFGTTAQIDEARALLDEAGYPDGFTMPTPYVYQINNSRQEVFVPLFQEQMKKVGIEIEIQQVTADTWISKHWNNDESFFQSSYADRLVDPTVHKLALHSDSAWNSGNWSNEAYDEQWEIAMGATDFETFKEAFFEMQRIHHLEGTWMMQGFVDTFTPYQNYMKNVDVRPSTGKKPFWNAYLTSEAPEGPTA